MKKPPTCYYAKPTFNKPIFYFASIFGYPLIRCAKKKLGLPAPVLYLNSSMLRSLLLEDAEMGYFLSIEI